MSSPGRSPFLPSQGVSSNHQGGHMRATRTSYSQTQSREPIRSEPAAPYVSNNFECHSKDVSGCGSSSTSGIAFGLGGFIILFIIVYIFLYYCKPQYLAKEDCDDLDNGKIALAAFIITAIIMLIFYGFSMMFC